MSDGNGEPSNADPLLAAWYRRARESQMTHYLAAAKQVELARRLGVPSVFLSAAAGTTLFATLDTGTAPPALRIVIGFVTLIAAALSALQTFLGLTDRAGEHRTTAAGYGAVRREIEQLQMFPPRSAGEVETAVTAIRSRLDQLAQSAPDVSGRSWRRAQREIEETARPEGFTSAYLSDLPEQRSTQEA